MADEEKDYTEATRKFLEILGKRDDAPHPLLHRVRQLGLKQISLAESFGVSVGTFNSWLHGKATMPEGVEEELNKLCLQLEKRAR
jgi:hypothetical protein